MSYFVYIIRSLKDGSLYIGQTNSLEERLARHNGGRSKYTKTRRPWELFHFEKFGSRFEAISRERKLKTLKRKDLLLKLCEL